MRAGFVHNEAKEQFIKRCAVFFGQLYLKYFRYVQYHGALRTKIGMNKSRKITDEKIYCRNERKEVTRKEKGQLAIQVHFTLPQA